MRIQRTWQLKRKIFCWLLFTKMAELKLLLQQSNDNKSCNSSTSNNNPDCWNFYLRKNRKVSLEIFHSHQNSSQSQYLNPSMTSRIALSFRHISDGFRTSPMIFGEKLSTFHIRYQVFNLAKNTKDDFSTYVNWWLDSAQIEEPKKQIGIQGVQKMTTNDPLPNPCYGCGGLHFQINCSFKNKKHFCCERYKHTKFL